MYSYLRILSLISLINCCTGGGDDVISLAASFPGSQFGPNGPTEALAKDLASVAIDVAAKPPAPCKLAMQIVVMTVTSVDEWTGQVGGPNMVLIWCRGRVDRAGGWS